MDAYEIFGATLGSWFHEHMLNIKLFFLNFELQLVLLILSVTKIKKKITKSLKRFVLHGLTPNRLPLMQWSISS